MQVCLRDTPQTPVSQGHLDKLRPPPWSQTPPGYKILHGPQFDAASHDGQRRLCHRNNADKTPGELTNGTWRSYHLARLAVLQGLLLSLEERMVHAAGHVTSATLAVLRHIETTDSLHDGVYCMYTYISNIYIYI